MHSSRSLIMTVIEVVRAFVDSPDADSKYNNDYLIRYIVPKAMREVWGQINQDSDNPIVIRQDFSLVVNQEYYDLPTNIQWVWRIAKLNNSGDVVWDWRPDGVMNPCGPGWALEGQRLAIRPFPAREDTITLWYVPSGEGSLIYYDGTGSANTSYSGTSLTLGTTPTLGWLDNRTNSYVGSRVRVMTNTILQERTVVAYNATTRVITVDTAFTGPPVQFTPCEIIPAGYSALWDAIALRSALYAGRIAGISNDRERRINTEYASAMKTIRDLLCNIQLRTGDFFDRRTMDGDQGSWIVWTGA